MVSAAPLTVSVPVLVLPLSVVTVNTEEPAATVLRVDIVRVEVPLPLLRSTVDGLKVPLAPVGRGEMDKFAEPLPLPVFTTVTV